MAFFTWEERLNTGIDVIDNQHRRIASHINALYLALQTNDKGIVGDTVIQLLDYTRSHLEFEEQLLAAAEFPGIEAHKAVHEHFNRRIHRYFKRHMEGKEIAIPLLSELKMWLTTHILHDDMEYTSCVSRYLGDNRLAIRMAS